MVSLSVSLVPALLGISLGLFFGQGYGLVLATGLAMLGSVVTLVMVGMWERDA